jgi:hypothetical protein
MKFGSNATPKRHFLASNRVILAINRSNRPTRRGCEDEEKKTEKLQLHHIVLTKPLNRSQ